MRCKSAHHCRWRCHCRCCCHYLCLCLCLCRCRSCCRGARVNIVVIVFSLQVGFVAGQSSHSCRYPTRHLESAFLPSFLHRAAVAHVVVQWSAGKCLVGTFLSEEENCSSVGTAQTTGLVSSSLFVFVFVLTFLAQSVY